MALSIPLTTLISFFTTGWMTYLPLIYAFGIIPTLELFFKADTRNFSDDQEAELLSNKWFDYIVWAMVPVQYGLLILFLLTVGEEQASIVDRIGWITGMGVSCGVIGINVAHELGHRLTKFEQTLGKSLLLTSLYMHFYIEHNRGHHKHVATFEDPSTARLNEPIFFFWGRSISQTWMKA